MWQTLPPKARSWQGSLALKPRVPSAYDRFVSIPVGGGGSAFFFNYCLSSLSFEGRRTRSELDLRVAGVPCVGTRGYPLAHVLRASVGRDTARLRTAKASLEGTRDLRFATQMKRTRERKATVHHSVPF